MKKMNNTVLQVRVNAELKEKSEQKAYELGFGSLNDLVRFFLNNVSQNKIDISLVKNKDEYLTDKQMESLEKDYQEFKLAEKRGETYTAKSANELMKYLEDETD